MSPVSESDPLSADDAPKQGGVSRLRISIGLFGAPTAWVVQLILSEPLVAHACYPNRAPLPAPIWDGLPTILVAISTACLLTALLSGFAAWTLWRRAKRNQTHGGASGLASSSGRQVFLAKLSLMSSFIFTVGILFNLCAVLLVPLCSSWF